MSRKSKDEALSQGGQGKPSKSFFERLPDLIPSWQRGRDQKTSVESDFDTVAGLEGNLGGESDVVVADHLESPNSANKLQARSSKNAKWWSEMSGKKGDAGKNQDITENIESADTELEMTGMTWGRHYKWMMGIALLLLVCAAGLGWKSYQTRTRLVMKQQALEQVHQTFSNVSLALAQLNSLSSSASQSSSLNAFLAEGNGQYNALLGFSSIEKDWENWNKVATQVAKEADDFEHFRQQSDQVSTGLHKGWVDARSLWLQAGQANQWNGQLAMGQAIDGLEAWASIAKSASNGKPLAADADPLEKAITQSLQSTSSLNMDSSALGATWKTVAQSWINQRTIMLELIANNPAQINRIALRSSLRSQNNALTNSLRNADQELSDAQGRAGSMGWIAIGLAFLSLLCVMASLYLSARQVRFYAGSARSELNNQNEGLQHLAATLHDITRGQSHARLQIKSGIIGEISHGLNQVLDAAEQAALNQARHLKDLSQSLLFVQTQSGEITDKSQFLLETLAFSGQALLDLEESTEILEKQSAAADMTLGQARNTSQEGGDAVRGVGKNMIDLQSRVQEVVRGVESLMETSRQIDGCVENLSHLAAQAEVLSIQTDLRAVQTENGAPFRLAAQEMHSLAEQNEVLIKRVAGLIESVIREGQNALEASIRANMTTESSARLGDLTEEAWSRLTRNNLQMVDVVEKMREAALSQNQAVANLTEHTQSGLGLTQELARQASVTTGRVSEVMGVCQVAIGEINHPKNPSS